MQIARSDRLRTPDVSPRQDERGIALGRLRRTHWCRELERESARTRSARSPNYDSVCQRANRSNIVARTLNTESTRDIDWCFDRYRTLSSVG